jgi:hypothetical protein
MRIPLRFLALAFGLQAVTSFLPAENLIINPGFEDGLAPWTENNWQHNEAKYSRDTDRPRSGNYSFEMDFIKAVGGANTAFIYPNLAVRRGQTLKISYWARGVSNGPALFLRVRKGGAPYTTYFQAESLLTDDWQEYTYTLNISDKVDPSDCQLFFYTILPGRIWLDDVSVTELPPVEAGTPPVANPIRNASFEAGRDGWTATFRKREFKTPWEESGGNYPSPDNAALKINESSDSPHGRRHLSFDIGTDNRIFLTSGYFPARYGHPMMLKFSLRSDASNKFQVGVGSGKNANYAIQGRANLSASDQWQKFSVPVTLKASLGGVYFVEFEMEAPGRYDLDAVSLTEIENPDVTLQPPATAIDAPAEAPAGHLYDQNQPARFVLRVAGERPEASLDYEIGVFDFLGRSLDRKTVRTTTDSEGYGETPFSVPTSHYGAFRVEARRSPATTQVEKTPKPELDALPLSAEQIYSVLPALPPPGERPDSFFGGHLDLSPYNLEIGRKAGFRWLRLYSPLSTQWMAIEREPGKWTFHTEDVARAKRLGFQILGNLGTVPDFAADIDPKAYAREKSRWRRSFIPADLDRWKDYVTRTINAFSPDITAWEIWNEPDGDYMRFRPELDRTTVYLSLLQAAREAIDANGKPVTLIGPAISGINESLGWKLLERGAGKLLDAYSFHYYSLAAGGDNPSAAFLTPILNRYQSYQNRAGDSLPLWHTEGGAYINGSQSWLQTYHVPPSSSVTPSQAAASMVRTALYFKASGVKRYFDFQVGASPSGRRIREDITDGFIDVTGIPGPGIASHAAMVAFVEDATPLGFETRTVGGHSVYVARFATEKGTVEAYWSPATVALKDVIDSTTRIDIRDMMGNPLLLDEARLGEFPVYVLTPKN